MNKQFKTLLLVIFTIGIFSIPAIAQVAPEEAYAIVTKVDAPTTVAPGATFEVIVTIEANLPDETYVEVGIYDPESYETMIDYQDEISGYDEASYSFELEALDVLGDFVMNADVFFEIDGELLFTEGSEIIVTVSVQEDGGGSGIPGYTLIALVFGLGLTALMLQNTKKTII